MGTESHPAMAIARCAQPQEASRQKDRSPWVIVDARLRTARASCRCERLPRTAARMAAPHLPAIQLPNTWRSVLTRALYERADDASCPPLDELEAEYGRSGACLPAAYHDDAADARFWLVGLKERAAKYLHLSLRNRAPGPSWCTPEAQGIARTCRTTSNDRRNRGGSAVLIIAIRGINARRDAVAGLQVAPRGARGHQVRMGPRPVQSITQ